MIKMTLTQKHFEKIAALCKNWLPEFPKHIFCHELAKYFATENELFDKNKFLEACGVE